MSIATQALAAIAAGHDRFAPLAAALNITKVQANKAVAVLKGRSFIVSEPIPHGRGAGIYKLTAAGKAWLESGREILKGQGARKIKAAKGLRERAWWHFRAHRMATMRDLLCTHADGTEKDASSNLYKYLRVLEKVGILERVVRKAPARRTPGGLIQWKLAKDLGPKAPVFRTSAREVFDPNSGKCIPIPAGKGHE